ncbi:ABC transporter permease [Mesorhizobium australicum]|uniref:Amino acid ABC transporter membrane protein 2, PAAT family n=1 Tax=Mesorhizobium australicum TaxID=536018 RepID=A0A1X7P8H4_9HYPH|nr:ABC transporter permease [Mesorhizobium australicum]SMH47311.1 amino acid ABC transporter membrane protein 2, PAAT family [Mesorhizobium australicum]
MSAVSDAEALDLPPPVERGWPGKRIAGYMLVGVWILLGLALVAYLVTAWDPALFERYSANYVSGLGVTLLLVGVSTVLGVLLSIPVTAMRMSKNRVLSAIAYAYVYFFRGTPLLAQTFLIYYGLGTFRPQLEMVGLWTFFREAWYCAVFAFTLNTAAYQAEILRGAIESVGKGQWEGAASLGLSKWQTLRMVILPQALIVALRPYGNELILMIKGSAIVAIITVYDLMGVTRLAYSRSFDFQTYIWAAIIYLAIVELLRNVVELIERRITRHLRR